MNVRFTKTIAVAATALMLGGAVLTSSAPANADPIIIIKKNHNHWVAGAFGMAAAGIVLGALSAQRSDDDEDTCGYVRQRIFDEDGDFIGYRNVPTC